MVAQLSCLGGRLEALYRTFNRREYVKPDPIQFLYLYPDPRDQEVVGVIASSLAYGRVAQILRSVEAVLSILGQRPAMFLRRIGKRRLSHMLCGFRHRFTTGDEMASLLFSVKNILSEYGSLEACFLEGYDAGFQTIVPALSSFVQRMRDASDLRLPSYLFPDPAQGSACKRPFMYLRWMVRRDDVDPGCWSGISPAKLVAPLDAHLFRITRDMGFTRRNSPDLGAAMEVTSCFREIAPDDPLKYDFVLTRFGIRKDPCFLGHPLTAKVFPPSEPPQDAIP
ncbi:MAG: TIGR02757 family protein [Deltaproteobacteria bacterium]